MTTTYVGIFEEDEKLVERVDRQEEVEDQNDHVSTLCLK